ncbi:MAG: ribonuclease III [Dehalococcoidia bacterium]|nr:ribonuclease III [Dehalococcoidia bacterium]
MPDLAKLQNIIDVRFEEVSLLERALVHRSYLNEYQGKNRLSSNERLEFLGDALLELVITEMLYLHSPPLTEGEMTRIRAALVCGGNLALVAKKLHLGDYLYLGCGEENSGGRERQGNLADAMEALIGAVFVDRGFDIGRGFIEKLFVSELKQMVADKEATIDYKSRLQELLQAKRHITPAYRTTEAVGPDHDKDFVVEVLLSNVVIGRGSGKSKHMAENAAAQNALKANNV